MRHDDTVTLEGIPEEPRDLLVADRALRLADVLEGADVPPGVLRSLGLPVDQGLRAY